MPLPRGAASHFFHTRKVIIFSSFLHLFWCSISAVHRLASAIFEKHDFWSNKRFPVQPWNFLFHLSSRRCPYGRPGRRVVPGLYQEPEKTVNRNEIQRARAKFGHLPLGTLLPPYFEAARHVGNGFEARKSSPGSESRVTRSGRTAPET